MIKKDYKWDKKKILNKAEELERRAKNLYKIEDDFGYGDNFYLEKIKLFEEAGECYLNIKKSRKAISCYESAANVWDTLITFKVGGSGIFSTPSNSVVEELATQYAHNKKKDLKNVERIKGVLKGNFHGLSGLVA